MPDKDERLAAAALPEALAEFTLALIGDLNDLRAGRITPHAARVRAQLAREVLRSVHLQLEGVKYLSGRALPAPRASAGAPAAGGTGGGDG